METNLPRKARANNVLLCGTREAVTTFGRDLTGVGTQAAAGSSIWECVQGCLPEASARCRTCHTHVDVIVRLSKLILEQDAVHPGVGALGAVDEELGVVLALGDGFPALGRDAIFLPDHVGWW